ncbi:MAG: restriction endonuclease subunit S [Burkholderiales bacterium]|nr:restriction endonuclease subunit S [Burkholderiales bacterium]
MIRSQNVLDHRFTSTGLANISVDQAKDLAGAEVQAGDVLLNITGDGSTFGRSCVVPTRILPACVNQHVVLIRTERSLCLPEYLLAWLTLSGTKAYIESFNAGGSRRAITKGHIESFDVPLPPIAVQRRIAKLASSINNRIDLLDDTGRTLEAIAGSIFQSCLVDFDPVLANAECCDAPGIAPQITRLFPHEFSKDKHGLLPRGWTRRPLDAIADYLNGLALQKFPPESDTEFLPVIKIAQLRAGNVFGADRASARLRPQYVVNDGDVLFSWSGSLEVEFWCGGQGALNQHLFKVTSDRLPKWFYYFATRQHLGRFREIAANKATTMGHIQRGHLSEAMAAVPPPELIAALDRVFEPLISRRITNAVQARKLAAVRDAFLPELISGALPVAEGEELVESADA